MAVRKNANHCTRTTLLKPAAAVGHPPRDEDDGDGRGQRPPERQNEVGQQPEHGEGDPEDLALHIPDCRAFAPRRIPFSGRRKNVGYIDPFAVETGLAPSALDAPRDASSRVSTVNQALVLSSSITL